jgi:hypothetical protein
MNRENVLAVSCALVRFAVCCYRAAHQSIIIDEATTYNQFVSGPWSQIFGRYDANNHTLSTILIKLTTEIAGLSEFWVRFASLVAGLFLTLGVFWILRQVQSRAIRWAAFALVCLHPMLLDFSIAARGYGLSLAFFVWALYFCLERRYLLAGILLGLSIASNLTILFPTLALLAAVMLLERKEKPVLNLAVPAFLLAALLAGPSLISAHREDFYTGYTELRPAVISFVTTSLHARVDRAGILGTRGIVEHLAMYLVPFSLLLLAAGSLAMKDRRKLLPFLTLVITMLGLVLAHWWFDLKYPADRTCLYFVILVTLAWAFAADAFRSRAIQTLWLLPLIVLTLQFSTQLQTGYFQFWRPQMDDKLIATLIRQASAGKPDGSLTISSSWIHQPSLEFYRHDLRIAALQPVERIEPAPLTGFDFYVLSFGDVDRARLAGLRTVFSDPSVGVILAVE